VDIVILEPTDWRVFKAIRLEALKLEPHAFGSTYQFEAEQTAAFFRQRLTNNTVFALWEDLSGKSGSARGMLAIGPFKGAQEKHKAFLWGMYIQADLRGSGFASELLQTALDVAAQQVEQVLLTVTASNTVALNLYRRAGFKEYGKEPRALKLADGGYEAEILMVKVLVSSGQRT
jgi:ribosomal protein S18 acetylase RimI-like enzyme